MVYGLWSRIPQRNTDNGYINHCESLWKWIDVIDDHSPIKAIKAIHQCFDHGIPWHLYIMEYLDWMFELNHKDFTYIQPSNQSYSTQILSCFFHPLWSHGKVCKPLDQAWRISRGFPGYPTIWASRRTCHCGRLSDWGFSKNSYRATAIEVSAKTATELQRLRFQQKQLQGNMM